MPLKGTASKQMITCATAKDFVVRLKAMGVPVENLREISPQFGVVAVDNNPDYLEDGGQYEYIARIWGEDQDIGLASVMLGAGGVNNFIKLAEESFVNQQPSVEYAQAFAAIMDLPKVNAAIDAALKF